MRADFGCENAFCEARSVGFTHFIINHYKSGAYIGRRHFLSLNQNYLE
jgi:hypothetical protein